MSAIASTSLRRGKASAGFCLQSIELLAFALSHLLCLDECCSVSLLVSTSFAAAKLHHIAGQFLLPTGEHNRSCLASTCHLVLTLVFLSLFPEPAFRQTGTTDDEQSLVASSLSSRTTTSLRSKLAPRQQPVACWLWTRMFILWTLSPIWFLSVLRRCCFRCV